jgi:30S ribosomal protein S31
MGKGDQRSRRGKIVAGSHGKRRPKKANKKAIARAYAASKIA